MNILITGGQAISALDLARKLKTENINIYTVDTFKDSLTSFSNTVKKSFVIPSPRHEFEAFRNTLIDIVTNYEIDGIIPACEEVFYISKLHKELSKLCTVYTGDIKLLNQLHNKYNFIELASDFFNVPKTKSYKKGIIDVFGEESDYIIKPVYSRFGNDLYTKENIKNFREDKNDYLIQELIKGEQVCSTTFVKNGEITFNVFYKSVLRKDKGAGICFNSYQNEKLLARIKAFVKHINFNGFISFDFILNEIDNEFYPIECNPRITSGIHFLKGKFDLEAEQHSDILDHTFAIKILLFGNLVSQPLKALKELFRAKSIIFSPSDSAPFFNQLKGLSHFRKISLKEGISLTEATTFDIEFNGE